MIKFKMISMVLSTSFILGNAFAKLPIWKYDPGPVLIDDPSTKDINEKEMNKKLIDIVASIPNMPEISLELLGEQKFRPAFGPIPWRMLLKPNSVKILFIGQDGTHIAEASERPATAGFGGRAQDLAAHFGVNESAAFINAYAYTIKGQYGVNQSPYIIKNENGESFGVNKHIDNAFWMSTVDQKGMLTIWRNKLIDWIIENNKDSLKMIVTFGKAAKDSMANYILAKKSLASELNLKNIKIDMVPQVVIKEWNLIKSKSKGELVKNLDAANLKTNFISVNAMAKIITKLKSIPGTENKNLNNLSDPDFLKIAPMIAMEILNSINVPEYFTTSAGGNNTWNYVINKKFLSDDQETKINENDLYAFVSGKNLDYKTPEGQSEALNLFKTNFSDMMNGMFFTKAGARQSGLMSLAQIDGYEFSENLFINNKKTISLKGLPLNQSKKIDSDVLVVELPHPTFLSNLTPEEASKTVAGNLKELAPYVKQGWSITPDLSCQDIYNCNEAEMFPLKSKFNEGKSYVYSRADIGTEYYDFGAPKNRMVNKSSAERLTSNVVIFGSRDAKAVFTLPEVKYAKNAEEKKEMEELAVRVAPTIAELKLSTNFPAASFEPNKDFVRSFEKTDLFIARPKSKTLRYVWDQGPGEEYAKIMKTNLDFSKIFRKKDNSQFPDKFKKVKVDGDYKEVEFDNDDYFEEYGIDAFNVKTTEAIGDFGHYRGTFNNPKVLVIADPMGFDDMVTARALTGERGQYLQGVMNDLGVGDQYLVLKTVPFGMDEATAEEWEATLEKTTDYRNKLFTTVMNNNPNIDFIICDGEFACKQTQKILGGGKTKILEVSREGNKAAAGFAGLQDQVSKIKGYEKTKITGQRLSIPRSHLSFYARMWQGTSGDRVINAPAGFFTVRVPVDREGKKFTFKKLTFKGNVFAVIVPRWAYTQKSGLNYYEEKDLNALLSKFKKAGAYVPGQHKSLKNFQEMTGTKGDL